MSNKIGKFLLNFTEKPTALQILLSLSILSTLLSVSLIFIDYYLICSTHLTQLLDSSPFQYFQIPLFLPKIFKFLLRHYHSTFFTAFQIFDSQQISQGSFFFHSNEERERSSKLLKKRKKKNLSSQKISVDMWWFKSQYCFCYINNDICEYYCYHFAK